MPNRVVDPTPAFKGRTAGFPSLVDPVLDRKVSKARPRG